MKTYLIIFAVIFLLAVISAKVNSIAEKKNKYSITAEISGIATEVFGIISVFMFFGGILFFS